MITDECHSLYQCSVTAILQLVSANLKALCNGRVSLSADDAGLAKAMGGRGFQDFLNDE